MFAAIEPGGAITVIFLLIILAVGIPLAIASMIFWIWMLISAVQNKGLSEGEKIAWVLVIVFVHCLGAILYFFIGHPKRNTLWIPPPRP